MLSSTFNGDIGQIVKTDPIDKEVTIRFDQREVVYDYGELDDVSLAFAITLWPWPSGTTRPRAAFPPLASLTG
jgi:hypothetical protein